MECHKVGFQRSSIHRTIFESIDFHSTTTFIVVEGSTHSKSFSERMIHICTCSSWLYHFVPLIFIPRFVPIFIHLSAIQISGVIFMGKIATYVMDLRIVTVSVIINIIRKTTSKSGCRATALALAVLARPFLIDCDKNSLLCVKFRLCCENFGY